MKPKYAVVLVTAPNLKVARTLARATLKVQLAACVNLVPALELLILKLHPYDPPEFLALPVTHGSRRYLDWIDTSIRTGR